jgi:hypothetical protein
VIAVATTTRRCRSSPAPRTGQLGGGRRQLLLLGNPEEAADPGVIWAGHLDGSNQRVLIGGQDAPYGVVVGA